MRKNALVIYNPSSGTNEAGKLLSDIVETLNKNNCRTVVYPVVKGFGAEEIIRAEKDNFDFVLLCGGDGTMNHAINELMTMENKPNVAFVPTGSTNDFGVAMQISKDVVENCTNIANAEPFYYDIGKLNDKYFNYIAAFGAFTSVSYGTSQEIKNAIGHTAYIIEALQHIPIGEYHHAKISANGLEFEGNYIYGSVSNTTSIAGFPMPVLEDVVLDDGVFEVILVRYPESLRDINNTILSFIRHDFNSGYIETFKTNNLKIEFDDNVSWTVDGEFGGELNEADIRVINKALGFLK